MTSFKSTTMGDGAAFVFPLAVGSGLTVSRLAGDCSVLGGAGLDGAGVVATGDAALGVLAPHPMVNESNCYSIYDDGNKWE